MWKLFHASFDLLIRSRQENWVYRPVSLQHWPGLAIDVGAQDISTRTAERLRSHLLGCSHKRAPNLKEFNAKELFPKHYIYIYIYACLHWVGWKGDNLGEYGIHGCLRISRCYFLWLPMEFYKQEAALLGKVYLHAPQKYQPEYIGSVLQRKNYSTHMYISYIYHACCRS